LQERGGSVGACHSIGSACSKAWQQQSTTPEMLSVLPDLAFCIQKKIIQAFLGVFEKKSGANVSKLYVESKDVIGRFS
jgi:hypothetical protein